MISGGTAECWNATALVRCSPGGKLLDFPSTVNQIKARECEIDQKMLDYIAHEMNQAAEGIQAGCISRTNSIQLPLIMCASNRASIEVAADWASVSPMPR